MRHTTVTSQQRMFALYHSLPREDSATTLILLVDQDTAVPQAWVCSNQRLFCFQIPSPSSSLVICIKPHIALDPCHSCHHSSVITLTSYHEETSEKLQHQKQMCVYVYVCALPHAAQPWGKYGIATLFVWIFSVLALLLTHFASTPVLELASVP